MKFAVDDFLNALELSNELSHFAKVLIKTEDDCIDFYINYFGNNNYIIYDLLDYRKSKIDMSISFDEFVELCSNKGIKKAFEEIFLYYFSPQIVEFIEATINEERITLEEIYFSFVENPDENILKKII